MQEKLSYALKRHYVFFWKKKGSEGIHKARWVLLCLLWCSLRGWDRHLHTHQAYGDEEETCVVNQAEYPSQGNWRSVIEDLIWANNAHEEDADSHKVESHRRVYRGLRYTLEELAECWKTWSELGSRQVQHGGERDGDSCHCRLLETPPCIAHADGIRRQSAAHFVPHLRVWQLRQQATWPGWGNSCESYLPMERGRWGGMVRKANAGVKKHCIRGHCLGQKSWRQQTSTWICRCQTNELTVGKFGWSGS